ncbi:MAG: flagellar basal body-associated FliL family protein [Methylobacter tundripaludum]|jgi:flagellar FliL protein|nr:flagellar basal body-associated FliL family protein [Methylobacter tundripaludum]MCK9635890.1 flagellar basal body-associated FliL family protein [Methylobacter tundripaludum]
MAELEQEDGEEKKSPKKLIIIIAAALILLIAGGGVTFFLMKGDSSKGEKVAHEDGAAVHPEKLYFDMSKPIIVDFPSGSAVKHGRITVSMLVEGAETIDVLKKNEPMIQNNLLMLIGAQDSSVLNTAEGKEMLRKAILDDVTAVLVKMSGKGKVDEIFFTSFVMK